MPGRLWAQGMRSALIKWMLTGMSKHGGKALRSPCLAPTRWLCSLETLGEIRRNIWESADCQGLESKGTSDLALARV